MLFRIVVIFFWLLNASLKGAYGRDSQIVLPSRQGDEVQNEKAYPSSCLTRGNNKNAATACHGGFKAGQYTIKKQNDGICTSKGEKQWTGTIDVTDERRLFFWFIDSRSDPTNDPIVVSIGGGPGGTSMGSLLGAIGPCILRDDEPLTKPNELSWNNNASMLIIDQPAGVGLSPLASGAALPSSDMDAAEDFQTFLRIFFSEVFPSKASHPIHLASGSYGGHFLPTYLHHILQSRRYHSSTAFWGNIISLVIGSPLIDPGVLALGTYELLCEDAANQGILNEADCQQLRESYPECSRLRQYCLLSNNPILCKAMMEYCTETMVKPYLQKGGHPIDVTKRCYEPDPLDCDFGLGKLENFVNQACVLNSLDLPVDFNFSAWNFEMRAAYTKSGSVARSSAGKIGCILDAVNESGNIADVRLLIIGGWNDPTCNVPGNKMAMDEINWSGQAEYRLQPWRALPEDIGHTGEWKGTKDGRLVFIAIDDAGHMLLGDQPETSYNIYERWLNYGWKGQ